MQLCKQCRRVRALAGHRASLPLVAARARSVPPFSRSMAHYQTAVCMQQQSGLEYSASRTWTSREQVPTSASCLVGYLAHRRSCPPPLLGVRVSSLPLLIARCRALFCWHAWKLPAWHCQQHCTLIVLHRETNGSGFNLEGRRQISKREHICIPDV